MTKTAGIEYQLLDGDNPFEVGPEVDLPQPTHPGIPHYSETMFFIAINPDSGATVFVHLGRTPGELEMWWAQTIVLLPDGVVIADRSYGRSSDPRGPGTGNLSVRCVEPLHRWELSFDGAGERTSSAETARRPIGAGEAVPMAFDLEFRAAAPVCDFARILGSDAFDWANSHQEQNLWSSGRLRVAGEEFDLTGVGFRDHSTGPRDFAVMGGDHFVCLGFPKSRRTLHGLVAWARETEQVAIRMAGIHEDGHYEILPHVEMTGLIDHETASPRDLRLELGRPSGAPIVLKGEVLHHFTITLGAPNVNVNGALLGRDDVLSSLSISRYHWPDGEPGYGLTIRDYRPSALPSPECR